MADDLPDDAELGAACDALKDRGLDRMAGLLARLVGLARDWERWRAGDESGTIQRQIVEVVAARVFGRPEVSDWTSCELSIVPRIDPTEKARIRREVTAEAERLWGPAPDEPRWP